MYLLFFLITTYIKSTLIFIIGTLFLENSYVGNFREIIFNNISKIYLESIGSFIFSHIFIGLIASAFMFIKYTTTITIEESRLSKS